MLLQDIRYGIRTLLNNRAFTAVAVLCLALGIGVNVTMFSVVDGVLLKPFPFADGERLVARRWAATSAPTTIAPAPSR